MSATETLNRIGGVPFLDTIHEQTLCTLVCLQRRRAHPGAKVDLERYFAPERASTTYEHFLPARTSTKMREAAPLPPDKQELIGDSLSRVGAARPEWRQLLAVPVQFRQEPDDQVRSSTNLYVPQMVWLGPRAFESRAMLDETLIHELAHVWLNFLVELHDLQVPESTARFVLPSGTKGKSLRGVLFAGHFAAAARRYFETVPGDEAAGRTHRLQQYLSGCVSTSAGHADLSVMGRRVWLSLQSAARTKPEHG